MPITRGEGFTINLFVNSDHAGDLVTRRSWTGYFLYLISALICWHSKKCLLIETSSFGSDFMAMKHATNHICGLKCKLCMIGILMNSLVYVYGDNKSILCNTMAPDSSLEKHTF